MVLRRSPLGRAVFLRACSIDRKVPFSTKKWHFSHQIDCPHGCSHGCPHGFSRVLTGVLTGIHGCPRVSSRVCLVSTGVFGLHGCVFGLHGCVWSPRVCVCVWVPRVCLGPTGVCVWVPRVCLVPTGAVWCPHGCVWPCRPGFIAISGRASSRGGLPGPLYP